MHVLNLVDVDYQFFNDNGELFLSDKHSEKAVPVIECFLFFVLFIEEPLREQKKRKREKELEKEEGTHNTLFIYCHTFLKEQDFILFCDTQYQGSFFFL